MDWLDEKFEHIMVKINNLRLKKALLVYILIGVVIVAVCATITIALSEQWDRYIWSKYSQEGVEEDTYVVYVNDYSSLTKLDRILVEVIDFIQSWSIIIYSILGMIGLSYLFYNNKLKEPLAILKEAMSETGQNNLEVDLYYNNKDEMGDLCRSFDHMRKQLLDNNLKMWDLIEEQKRLNAAFAHDLRTPLTVLRGYTDLLRQYVPEGKISEEKLLTTLSMMSDNIIRLERYSNTMKEISSLEELPIHRTSMKPQDLENKLKGITEVIYDQNRIRITVHNPIPTDRAELQLDETILLQVYENLISNALRYAVNEIEITLSVSEEEQKLLLSVADDGKGFTKKGLFMATKAYYSEYSDHKSEHFGIGLYICKILLEKHSGELIINNRLKQGAIVTAVFTIA